MRGIKCFVQQRERHEQCSEHEYKYYADKHQWLKFDVDFYNLAGCTETTNPI